MACRVPLFMTTKLLYCYFRRGIKTLFPIGAITCPLPCFLLHFENTKHIRLTSFVLKPHFFNSQSSKNCFLPLICSVCVYHIFKAFTQSNMDSQWQVWKSFNIQKENNCPAYRQISLMYYHTILLFHMWAYHLPIPKM